LIIIWLICVDIFLTMDRKEETINYKPAVELKAVRHKGKLINVSTCELCDYIPILFLL